MRSCRRTLVTAMIGAVVAMGLVTATGSPSLAQTGGPSVAVLPATDDYATALFSDQWDYSNPEDLHAFTPGMDSSSYNSNGTLSWVTNANALHWIDPVVNLSTALQTKRDGPRTPINAGLYTHLAFRMYSSTAFTGVWTWDTCSSPTTTPDCRGEMFLNISAGWKTYDVAVTNNGNQPGYTRPWAGSVIALRFIWPHTSGIQMSLDWMRVHAAGPSVSFTAQVPRPSTQTQLFWDADTNLANNTDTLGGKDWGYLGTVTPTGSTTTASFPAAAYPPGTYRVYAVSGGTTGDYSVPLTITARPQPVIYSPSATSGPEYSQTYNGHGWLSSASDVAHRANISSLTYANGVWTGVNGGTEIDNPFIQLPWPKAVAGSTWHNLTIRYRYDGPMGLAGGPTGGSVARVIWFTGSDPARRDDQNLRPFVTWPGPYLQTYQADLNTNPSWDIVDHSQANPVIGWAGQTITSFRFDPNEDVSARRWQIQSIELHADDAGVGAYTFAFADAAWAPGTTAAIYVDPSASGAFNGWGINSSPIPVNAGKNSYRWTLPAGFPNGTYHVYVTLHHPDGTTAHTYASGVVRLNHTPPPAPGPPNNLYGVSTQGTGTGSTEVHALSAASRFQQFLLHTGTALGPVSLAQWQFRLADYNRDGITDLWAINTRGASGHTEIHILNGADHYHSYLLHTTTALPVTDLASWTFAVADANRDGHPDLYAVDTQDAGSNATAEFILDGTNPGRYLLQTGTALPHLSLTGNQFLVGDMNNDGRPDLWDIKTQATGSGHTETHVIDGSRPSQFLQHAATALALTDLHSVTYALADYNLDGHLDLYAVNSQDTGSGTTAVNILNGAGLSRYLLQTGSALGHTTLTNWAFTAG